jgi:L-alanine-DL-glutamate epimerase-like enolase superfamily enzyme
MNIKEIILYKAPVKLKVPFKISLGTFDYANNIIVVIKTSSQIIGYGECSPFMTIHGESMDTAFIVGQYLAKHLIGKSALDIEELSTIMDRVIYGNTCIKSAFNIGLYDIASQHAQMPLYRFLGGINNKTLQTDYTISIDTPEKMVQDAISIVDNGFKIIKVKLGGSKELDCERIRLIREAVGKEIPIRIDANQGWSVQTAIEILQELAQYTIQHCEEPIPRWLYTELPLIRAASPIPIMADESCFDQRDARRLIDMHACDLFNIKLSKSSGISRALQIVALAETASMKIQMGGFLESRLGFTAAAHVALSSSIIEYIDFDTPLMFIEDPVTGGIIYGKNGIITVPDSVGLGASYDQAYLDKQDRVIIN